MEEQGSQIKIPQQQNFCSHRPWRHRKKIKEWSQKIEEKAKKNEIPKDQDFP